MLLLFFPLFVSINISIIPGIWLLTSATKLRVIPGQSHTFIYFVRYYHCSVRLITRRLDIYSNASESRLPGNVIYIIIDVYVRLGGHFRDDSFGSKVGHIDPKWDKSGAFSDQISVHLARANLTNFGAKPTIPGSNSVRSLNLRSFKDNFLVHL